MTPENLIFILQQGNQLKRTTRTGWEQRGVPNAENVAAHSYGVAFTAMLLAQVVDSPVDRGKLLSMALLHDLPEALTSDIPQPATRFFPAGLKETIEEAALVEIFQTAHFTDEMLVLWTELTAAETVEAQLVHDADKIDLYLQAYNYSVQTGNHRLAEFWTSSPTLHFPQSVNIYQVLRAKFQTFLQNSP
jgi:putative hydrolase of HD superfamily